MTARVESAAELTPTLRRIVFGGAGLAAFQASPFSDSYVKLRFPAADARDGTKVRSYTVRDWDAAARRLTIDFVVHGDGVAGRWAARAVPGDELKLRGPGGAYAPDPEAAWHLMAGDLSVVPAIATSLARVKAGVPVHVFLQVHGSDEEVELASPGDLRVHWLHGDADDALAAAIAAADLPSGDVHAFLHGEATAVRLARRHLVVGRRVPAARLSASGYWKRSLTDEGWRAAKAQWKELVDAEAAAG
jgi:NADPH-dependent ferric siderophore reductase